MTPSPTPPTPEVPGSERDAAATRNGGLPAPGSLRVVILSDAMPSRNGVGTYYEDLADHLRDRVREVTLISPPADTEGEFSGLTMAMPGDPTQRLYFPGPFRLWRKVKKLDPHVVISATPGGFGFLGLAYSALLRSAFCVGYHTEYSELAQLYWENAFGRAYKGILAVWDQMMFRFGSVILVTNEDLLEAARAGGANDARIMGTPVQKKFLEMPLKGLPERLGTVSYVGRLAPEKRLDQVKEAAERMPDLRFRIAGDGPLRDQVQRWAGEQRNLDYLGWVSRGEVMEILDATDLLVLPSRFETFGTAAFEAMIRRRLALVSPNCGITRWPELEGGLFVAGEGEPLHRAIQRLRALDPTVRRNVAEKGAEAARRLSLRTVEEWEDVLCHAVAEKRYV